MGHFEELRSDRVFVEAEISGTDQYRFRTQLGKVVKYQYPAAETIGSDLKTGTVA